MSTRRRLRTRPLRGLRLVLAVAAVALGGLRANPARCQETAARPVLSGRITDERGSPVADAQILLSHVETGIGSPLTLTTDNGDYSFKRVSHSGEHRLMIVSNRCLGFTKRDDCPRVVLDPQKPTVRNFVLKLACQLRVQALDEEGHPVPNVMFFAPGPARFAPYPQSDRNGWALIGGLQAAASQQKFGAQCDGFALTYLSAKLDDPSTVEERKIVMKRGIDVKGTVICSDGKPGAGWRVLAMPAWWDFLSYPNSGERIAADGSFVLRNVGPGAHRVSVAIVTGTGGGTSSQTVLSSVDLAAQKAPLALKLDVPSPGAMGQIEGRVRYLGGRPKRAIMVNAQRDDGGAFFATGGVSDRGDTFRIGPLPPGRYRVRFNSPEIESKEIASIAAPTKDLQVDIRVRGLVFVRGAVLARQDQKPLTDFRIRVTRLRTRQRSNFYLSPNWRQVSDPQGHFTEELPGPGIYVIETTADGFTTARSQPIDTGRPLPKELRFELSRGVSVSGTVVDEAGRPINGATVIPVSRAGGPAPLSLAELPAGMGVKTVDGRFAFAGLDPGKETFHVLHPDYAPAILDLDVEQGGPNPTFVMHPGGTVYGTVQDHLGRLASGVTLHFQTQKRLATAVTDGSGYYEVHHLPEQLVHVFRDDQWHVLGVVRQAILPANGKKRKLDFGTSSNDAGFDAPPRISGQLFVNGKPLANKRVLISSDSPHSGDFTAIDETDADGKFLFLGIPLGVRYLFYADDPRGLKWHRVRELRISTSRNFGRIDHRVGKLTVQLPALKNPAPGSTRVSVTEEAAGPFHGHDVGFSAPRRSADAPWVFDNVPPGKYAVTATLGEGISVRTSVETTPANLDKSISIAAPSGTASIRGTLDPALREAIVPGSYVLRRTDESIGIRANLKDDGSFEVTELPAGEYSLGISRQATAYSSSSQFQGKVSLKGGQVTTFHLGKGQINPPKSTDGILYVTVFTAEGIPLPGCMLHLTGPAGTLPPKFFNPDNCVIFQAAPGKYDLTAAFFGFQSVTRPVELKTMNGPRVDRRDLSTNVTLTPLK